ncbi:MAG: ribbon-helix-helix domain-containing protein [Candidatus Andeanibacterium colombiense]|uniref:Ribbon-helix-helix domain-containing protein n=1 Tax=Candidatus Andeanibacterium colombiense TaxID=3121345 RepID=A0AAJ5X6U2_9SPHN|nr:MAG: ribbon-helix-helix domain-containing protein [Sphingomonadaceae bacterium]
MGEETVRWTIVVDKATDIDLRTYLASQGMKKGDLSKFVQDAVNRRLLRETINEIRTGFADLSAEEAQALADEAVAWARKDRTA